MNPSTPFSPPRDFAEAQNSGQTLFAAFLVIFVIIVIIAVAKSVQNQAQYTQAKQDYLNNPDDIAAKLRMIETAPIRNGNPNSSGIEALAIMEATREPVVVNNVPASNLSAELESLASLHEKGHLSDDEFEKAKSKLLS